MSPFQQVAGLRICVLGDLELVVLPSLPSHEQTSTVVAGRQTHQNDAHGIPLGLELCTLVGLIVFWCLRQLQQSAVVVRGPLQDKSGTLDVVVACEAQD